MVAFLQDRSGVLFPVTNTVMNRYKLLQPDFDVDKCFDWDYPD